MKINNYLFDETKYRSKRKRRETLCKDKKRGFLTCGICGSEDIIEQSIYHCNKCGNEVNYITEQLFFIDEPHICMCDKKIKDISKIYVRKCITCGAVEAKTCPSCGHYCWTGVYGDKFCKNCGFMRGSYKK
jgi:hypothetical protein